MMRAVIIEDEKEARDDLISQLASSFTEIDIVGTATGVSDGLRCLYEKQPDLLFLDIMLRDGTGLEILEKTTYHNFALIFTTAHNQYARQAIAFEAMAYLDKPIAPEELKQAIERAKKNYALRGVQKHMEDIKLILKNYLEERLPQRIVVHNSAGIHYLPLKMIKRLEVEAGVTTFFLEDNSKVSVSANLKKYEEQLKEHPHFMRIHKSHLVNLEKVRQFNINKAELLLIDGKRIPVGRRHISDLKNKLERLLK